MEDVARRLDGLPWVIVGAGRVGRMMALVARAQGRVVRATWNRSEASAAETRALLPEVSCVGAGALEEARAALFDGGPVVCWVTVVDDAIEPVTRVIADALPPGSAVLHMAGSMGSGVLRAAGVGASVGVGSLHPLQAITDPARALEHMASVTWTLEGDPEVVVMARGIMAAQGVEPLPIDGAAKALYHASAVCAANLLVGLMDAAYAMAGAAGIGEEDARDMLVPLTQSCLDNLRTQRPRDALTGPTARGDFGTIARHMDALRAHPDPALAGIYEVLTERALELMRREHEA